MPSSILSLITTYRQPVFEGIIPSILKELFQSSRPNNEEDESVDSFFHRRFGPRLADNILSAVIHGIYAGDTKYLSLASLFPSLREYENRYGSIVKAVLINAFKRNPKDPVIAQYKSLLSPKILARLEEASVWGLQGGLERLSLGLIKALKETSNVDIRLNTRVNAISTKDQADSIQVCIYTLLYKRHYLKF